MKHKVLIVGAGPRGIAVAIEAKYRGYDCVLIDRDPMGSWDDAAPNMVMRSPLSFDLVYPGADTWDTSSLIRYVHPGSTEPVWGKCLQKELEYMPERCTRDVFMAYAKHCLQELDVPIIRDRVLKVSKMGVRTTRDEYIKGDLVVIATGLSPITEVPPWVVPVSHKLITAREVIDGVPKGVYAVVGNGQSGAEYCELLARQGNKVYWLVNGVPRVTQYPAPTYIDWGLRSALSGYYRTIPTPEMKQEYLMQIKAWQPSITPYISMLMQQHGTTITVLEGPGTREGYNSWESLQRKITGVLLCTGNKPAPIDYVDEPNKLSGRLVLDRFIASNGVYHTGLLAIGYDGPRQASFISAGITAKEIIDAHMDSQS
ncbi:pyridine nucleotide-disulfide oxidoreductase [Microcoleus phage My-WqHQDG]|nr:pyridine nucleotide-disulfide oxidoreductase [Microcoleus phage My-WqHQDG]